MIRFVSIEKDDILTDPEDVASMLTKALKRKIPMRFSGLCDNGSDTLTAVLEETASTLDVEFVFSPFESSDTEDINAAIECRYEAGYSTVSVFPIGDTVWGLFARER